MRNLVASSNRGARFKRRAPRLLILGVGVLLLGAGVVFSGFATTQHEPGEPVDVVGLLVCDPGVDVGVSQKTYAADFPGYETVDEAVKVAFSPYSAFPSSVSTSYSVVQEDDQSVVLSFPDPSKKGSEVGMAMQLQSTGKGWLVESLAMCDSAAAAGFVQ
ncbi:MAG: hypothetical protein ACXWEJ_01895 [Actinomycetota bacterium]